MQKHQLLERMYSRIDQLPTLPTVLPRVLSLLERSDTDTEALAKAIEPDLALTAKVLTVANSAYYGFSRTISTLERAVPLLGLNTIRSLAISMAVINTLPSQGHGAPGFDRQKLWTHSLAVANCLEHLGKVTGFETPYLFTIGLLHDVGIIILDQFFPRLFAEALAELAGGNQPTLPAAETRVVGFDHGEVGALLLQRWKFPEVITVPIRYHHRDDLPKKGSRLDVVMLRTADALAHRIEWAGYGHPYPEDIEAQDIEYLGLTPDNLQEARQHLDESKDQISAFFAAMN